VTSAQRCFFLRKTDFCPHHYHHHRHPSLTFLLSTAFYIQPNSSTQLGNDRERGACACARERVWGIMEKKNPMTKRLLRNSELISKKNCRHNWGLKILGNYSTIQDECRSQPTCAIIITYLHYLNMGGST
jgi:hypothetical protein